MTVKLHFSSLCFCPLCWILIDHRDLGLFLDSLFHSIDLCVCSYASTRLFWLQWPCSTVWYQVLWSHLLCSSCSKLLQLFGVIYGSIWISEMFVVYLWNIQHNYVFVYLWNIQLPMLGVKYVIGTLIGIALNLYIALGSMAILMMLILPIHEHGTCFHLFVSSLISFFSVV